MTNIAAGGQLEPVTKTLGKSRAAGIYGAIITAAILDTAGAAVLGLVMIGLKDLVLLHLH